MAAPNNLVVFHYSYSPYARRILWYLALRGIPYAQCIQPSRMPRPDIAALGIAHRRIPIVAIGRDVYFDTRLILKKLEAQFPQGALGAQNPEQKLIQELLARWVIDGDVFRRGAGLIPLNLPNMNDPAWLKDRGDFSGTPWDREKIRKARPENEVAIRDAFLLVENTILADGRNWVLKTEKPTLADIEAVWVFDWLIGMKDALPPDSISEERFPRVFAWVKRFKSAWKSSQSSETKPMTLKGDEAVKQILNADFAEQAGEVDKADPLRLQEGMEVEVWPIDSGANHRDRGRLVALCPDEVVLEVKARDTKTKIRLHAPRRGFRIVQVRDEKL